MPALVQALKRAGERGDLAGVALATEELNAGVRAMRTLTSGVFTVTSKTPTKPDVGVLRVHMQAQLDRLPSDLPGIREAFETAIEEGIVACGEMFSGQSRNGTARAEVDYAGQLHSLEVDRATTHGLDSAALSESVKTAITMLDRHAIRNSFADTALLIHSTQ